MNSKVNKLIESIIPVKGSPDIHPLAKLFADNEREQGQFKNKVKSKWKNIVAEVYGISEKAFSKWDDMDRVWEEFIFPTYAQLIDKLEKENFRASHVAEIINYRCSTSECKEKLDKEFTN